VVPIEIFIEEFFGNVLGVLEPAFSGIGLRVGDRPSVRSPQWILDELVAEAEKEKVANEGVPFFRERHAEILLHVWEARYKTGTSQDIEMIEKTERKVLPRVETFDEAMSKVAEKIKDPYHVELIRQAVSGGYVVEYNVVIKLEEKGGIKVSFSRKDRMPTTTIMHMGGLC
jgi:hypothetical protein